MEWKLNSQEWDALFDLQAEAVKVYVMGIRPYMDYATGIVGIKRKFSYQSLSELLSIPAGRGSQKVTVTRDKIKWVMSRLESAGLITRIDQSWFKIKLNLASVDESVQTNYTQTTPRSTPISTPKNEGNKSVVKQCGYDDCDVEAHPELHMYNSPNYTTPPDTGITNIDISNNTYMSSSSDEPDVDQEAKPPDPIAQLFERWRQKLNHPRAVLDKKRKRSIEKALKLGYSIDDLCDAIDGCAMSPWHTGENPQKTKYDDLTLIFRDASKIESFINCKTSPPKAVNTNGANRNGKPQDWYYNREIELLRSAREEAGLN